MLALTKVAPDSFVPAMAQDAQESTLALSLQPRSSVAGPKLDRLANAPTTLPPRSSSSLASADYESSAQTPVTLVRQVRSRRKTTEGSPEASSARASDPLAYAPVITAALTGSTSPTLRRHTISAAGSPSRLSVVENPSPADALYSVGQANATSNHSVSASPAPMGIPPNTSSYYLPNSPSHATTRTRTRSMTRKMSENIGTKIDKTHEKYQFMFHMLTGIRVSVSRCEAKEDRDKELLPADFTAQHKLTSDVTGAEIESSKRYDFKFKDYAPYAFRKIRVSFGASSSDYLNSLTGKYILSELFSPGKSKSFLYFSHDYRYIIKTIHRAEKQLLLKILPAYVDYVSKNQNTLLARYYGLHRVKVPGGPAVHFVVMSNVFPPTYDIHETFDLKGSTIGRETTLEEITRKGKRAVMKDLNWVKLNRTLKLGFEKEPIFIEQLEKDVRLLMGGKIMDYSLLIGIHYLNRGNGGESEDVLKVAEPNKETLHRALSTRADAMREAIRHPDLTVLSHQSKQDLVPNSSIIRKTRVFFADNGGFLSANADNSPGSELYFMSIIDILTPYDATKRVEHMFKSLTQNGSQISAVPPEIYGKRFIAFMKGLVDHFPASLDNSTPSTIPLRADLNNHPAVPPNTMLPFTLPPSGVPIDPTISQQTPMSQPPEEQHIQ